MLTPGTVVSGYRIESLIGAGGMGTVYEATQLSLNRTVALKILANGYRVDPVFRERFRREAIAQASLEHPHIVPVYEADERDGQVFIAMRYIRGPNLKNLLAAGELDPSQMLLLLGQIAGSLDAAHAVGLVHRDIKPQNILVEGDNAYLADFGLTRARGDRGLTKTGQQVGTLDYMSPEQIRNQPATSQSDIYSFGAVMYECLSGDVPYPRDSEIAVMYAHLEDPPPTIDHSGTGIPAEVDLVIGRAMAKDPDVRQTTATAVIDEIALVMGSSALAITPRSGTKSPEGLPRSGQEGETVIADLRVRSAGVSAAGSPRDQTWRTRISLPALVTVLALMAGGVAAGAILKRATTDSRPSGRAAPPQSRIVRTGFASLRAPAPWRLAPGVSLSDPRLSHAQTLALSSGTQRVTFMTGIARSAPPGYLPAGLRSASPRRAIQVTSGLEGYEYVRTSAPNLSDRFVTYVFPTTRGTFVAICRGIVHESAGQSPCDGLVATLSSRAKTLFNTPSVSFARGIELALSRLSIARIQEHAALSRALTSTAQAAEARRLGATFARAALAVNRLPATRLESQTKASITRALRATSRAYSELATAAASANRTEFRTAAQRTAVAEGDVSTSILHLGSLGYRLVPPALRP